VAVQGRRWSDAGQFTPDLHLVCTRAGQTAVKSLDLHLRCRRRRARNSTPA
jgi:hypothetical protein